MLATPHLEKTTRLVARALGLSAEELNTGFRPAKQADLAQVLVIREHLLGTGLHWDDAAYLTWRYHFGDLRRGRGDCWVLVRGSQVIGMVGTERLMVLHRKRRVPAISVMDIAMHPEFEGLGLGPWMAMRLCQQFGCVLAVGSNPKSRGIVSKIFGRQPDRRCYAHLLSSRTVLARKLPWPSASAVLAPLVDMGLKLWRTLRWPAPASDLTLRPIRRFDSSAGVLLKRSVDPEAITLERSPASLNWRLFDIPRTAHTVWGAYREGVLIGYIATHFGHSAAAGKFLTIEDCLVLRGERQEVRLNLISHAIAHALQAQCERVAVIACHGPTEAALKRLGFIRHSNDYETFSVSCSDKRLDKSIATGTAWHIFGIHTDRDVL
jgi:hypothetical protein